MELFDFTWSAINYLLFIIVIVLVEYYGAAEPPVRCGESHLSGLTEPPRQSSYLAFAGSIP
jgi:hypothetical protein